MCMLSLFLSFKSTHVKFHYPSSSTKILKKTSFVSTFVSRHGMCVAAVTTNLMHSSERPGFTFHSRIFEFSHLPGCQKTCLMMHYVLWTREASLRHAIVLGVKGDWSSA